MVKTLTCKCEALSLDLQNQFMAGICHLKAPMKRWVHGARETLKTTGEMIWHTLLQRRDLE